MTVKNLHPLHSALGYFDYKTNALQHICDVIDSSFLSNSQDVDRLKGHKSTLYQHDLTWLILFLEKCCYSL